MAKRHPKTFLCFLTLALCLVAQSSYATIPTLETDSGALELRIADGIEANAVAFDDVWHWPDGVSAGSGLVPKDGGGTVLVSTFLTEIIPNAVYIIHKNLAFGDGSTSSWFSSLNEMIYYEDGNVFEILSAATLSLGELSGEWGINGSTWSVGPSVDFDIISFNVSAISLSYNSTLHYRTNVNIKYRGGVVVTLNSMIKGAGTASLRHYYDEKITALTIKRLQMINVEDLTLNKSPDIMLNVFSHAMTYSINTSKSVDVFGIASSSIESSDVRISGNSTVNYTNPARPIFAVSLLDDLGVVNEQYTANIHVSDSSGSDLEGATVTMESFGNVVKNASTFYRCLEDHTAGTFATDLSAGKWIVTSVENAAKAGVTGASPSTGLWVTLSDYTDAEELFSEVTDSEGNIDEQIANYKRWKGTSEVLGSFAPYQFSILKPSHVTLRPDLVAPTIIDGTVQPFVEHWQLESGATKRPRAQRHGQ